MNHQDSPRLQALFRFIVAKRWWFLALYALLLPIGIHQALKVESDNSINRLIVESDPDFRNTRAFQRLFPEGEQVILLAEAPDPFAPEVTARVGEIERRLNGIRRVEGFSALTIYARARPGGGGAPDDPEEFRGFATGTGLFRKQGLVGDDFLGIALEMDVRNARQRNDTLSAIDRVLAPFETALAPLTAIRRVGGPYVDAYLEAETARASLRYFPLFGLFVVVINLALYRSVRTLAAFLATLAVCVSLTVAFARVVGYPFTIVSSLVPVTILITATAALVYIQSRFVEYPGEESVDEHQVFTLANKFMATTASIFAAAVGFAALSVSGIRPIREMGLWVAAGLLLTWIVVFTLFPALQKVLATPVLRRRTTAGRMLLRLIDVLPGLSYRWRWAVLAITAVLMIMGAAALAGIPRVVPPMGLETDALDYIEKDLPLYRDIRRFEQAVSGLSVIQVWITTPSGEVLEPEVLRGLEGFTRRLETDPAIGSVTGPTTLLRWSHYIAGQEDRLSDDPSAWEGLAVQMEQLLLEEPSLRAYVDIGSLSSARLRVVYRGTNFPGVQELKDFIRERWDRSVARYPSLGRCRMEVAGEGLLQAKIAHYLVPTLTESFFLTAAIIFFAYLLVFRSAAARLMAIIPSLFAILVMFLVMRLVHIPLNVATILIASTVLGASENDQIHFFYHFQEKRNGASTEQALRHTLLIAGRAIVFATLINAGGFLALALSGLPPMRQFGIISASAFVLSMVASFTALPASRWIFFHEKPDLVRAGGGRPEAKGGRPG